jgi:hypothetical protein
MTEWNEPQAWDDPQLWDTAPGDDWRGAQVVTTETRLQFFRPAPPPPPPPAPVVYLPRPKPAAPNAGDLAFALIVFAAGVMLIGLLTGWSAIWIGIVAAFVGIAALIFGFALFINWSDKFFSSR